METTYYQLISLNVIIFIYLIFNLFFLINYDYPKFKSLKLFILIQAWVNTLITLGFSLYIIQKMKKYNTIRDFNIHNLKDISKYMFCYILFDLSIIFIRIIVFQVYNEVDILNYLCVGFSFVFILITGLYFSYNSNINYDKSKFEDEVLGIIYYNNIECGICIDTIQTYKNVKLNCEHSFHFECLYNCYLNDHKTCPLCRQLFIN